MRISTIVGNPPYQGKPSGNSTKSPAIYDGFMDAAQTIADNAVLITPARFLRGNGVNREWSKRLLNNRHFRTITVNHDASAVFPDVGFKGGIAIHEYNWAKDYEPIREYVGDEIMARVLAKVRSSTTTFVSAIIHTPTKYNLEAIRGDGMPVPEDGSMNSNAVSKHPYLFHSVKPDDGEEYLSVLARVNSKRVWVYINRRFIAPDNCTDKYKVLVPFVNGGKKHPARLTAHLTVVAEPNTGFTQTFYGFGAFDTSIEAWNLNKYVHTRFFVALLYTIKCAQAMSRNCYANIPMQDYTSESDIDWTQDTDGIDQQLYEKYGLTIEEQEYINTTVE